ncbi:MAG: glycoside hydrolase family 3 protein [Thermoanaerobaculia bacterium]
MCPKPFRLVLASALAVGSAMAAQFPHPLPPEKLAGQLIGVGLDAVQGADELDLWVGDRSVGLLIAYRSTLEHPERAAALTARIRSLAPEPSLAPLIAVDQEGGSVIRFDPATLPGAMALGATGDRDLARRAGAHTGCALRTIGVNTVFAPVLDLARPGSPLGTRSFGSDPDVVNLLGGAVIAGLGSSGVAAIAKHFPGQGGAQTDTHRSRSVVGLGEKELRAADLRPFVAALSNGVAGVMTAHASYAGWPGEEGVPATLSKGLITGLLREELEYDGLVVTDVLDMPGFGTKEPGELAVRAIEAGADMVLVVARRYREPVYRAILDAIQSGRLTRARVETSVRRVARIKTAAMDAPLCRTDPNLALEITRRALTAIGGPTTVDPGEDLYTGPAGELSRAFRGRQITIPFSPEDGQIERSAVAMAARIRGVEGKWVAAIHNRGHGKLIASTATILDRQPDVLIVLGSPWDVRELRPTRTIFSFGLSEDSQRGALEVARGARCAPGRLPVTVEGIGREGEGGRDCVEESEEVEAPVSSGDRGSR